MLRKLRTTAIFGCAYLAWGADVRVLWGDVDDAEWVSQLAERRVPPPPVDSEGPRARVVETRRVVPSDGLPVAPDRSNNNLDVARHDGRTYLAWRTAPSHFAGNATRIEVVSSADERTWTHEASFALGTDLREPRLLSFDGSLFLYVSELGSDPLDFEPRGVRVSERAAAGKWSELEPMLAGGTIAWRVRVHDGVPLMVAYGDGAAVYDPCPEPMRVQLLTTRDGRRWSPLEPKRPAVVVGGGSEADFAFADSGELFAVVRNEAGDADGFGSKLCRAPASDWTRWSCRADRRKFDSPFAFSALGEPWVMARRHVTPSGEYDVGQSWGPLRSVVNQLAYVREPKRCALWRFDRDTGRPRFVLDLPSRGDTCFPAVLPGGRRDGAERVIVYDYSSDIRGPDLPWSAGQRRPTYIYRHVVEFRPR